MDDRYEKAACEVRNQATTHNEKATLSGGYRSNSVSDRPSFPEPAARGIETRRPGTLDTIAERILRAARDAREIGFKLNEHANMVHGPVDLPCGSDQVKDEPNGLIDRIFAALTDLDEAQSFMAQAAGRNSTLT